MGSVPIHMFTCRKTGSVDKAPRAGFKCVGAWAGSLLEAPTTLICYNVHALTIVIIINYIYIYFYTL